MAGSIKKITVLKISIYKILLMVLEKFFSVFPIVNQRTNGPVNAHLRSVVRIYQ